VRHRQYPEYAQAVTALEPILYRKDRKLIAIDGPPGSGKTTLGRYLAWHFNVSLIETDWFLIPGRGRLVYREDEIARVIESRRGRPTIVEGVAIRRLMARIKCPVDYTIFVTCDDLPDSPALANDLASYESEFNPRESADIVLELQHYLGTL
jgi:adenylate kinase family enzyme